MDGDDNDPQSEHMAQAWAAAQTSNQPSQAYNNADQYHAIAPNVGSTIPGGGNTMGSAALPTQPPPFEPAIPQRRRLPSYVSEPPSTLLALSMMAEEEAAAHEKAELDPSPYLNSNTLPAGAACATAAATATQGRKRELKADITLREMAWMHTSPHDTTKSTNKTTIFGRSHLRTEAGDLAGAELRQRRRPPPIRLNSLNAPRSLSPSRTIKSGSIRSAGGGTGNPRTRVSNIQGLVRRRDAGVLFADSKSDSDDDDDSGDVDKVAKGGVLGGAIGVKGASSPRSDTLQEGGKLGSEFDIEMPISTPKRPFYCRRQFWVFFLFTCWTLAFVTAGVCLLVFTTSDNTTKLQAWRLCFFVAGLPIIWYIGDFVTQMIVWAVERSMFTVKNALYFAYAVRVRNDLREILIYFNIVRQRLISKTCSNLPNIYIYFFSMCRNLFGMLFARY
jgi:hypothetical protein